MHSRLSYRFSISGHNRWQASEELVCKAHGPVDCSAHAGYTKEALLVMDALFKLDGAPGDAAVVIFDVHDSVIACGW